jgi:hypothetical protein
MESIFVTLIIFGFIFGIIYIHNRRKERMSLLDRGLEGDYFEKGKTPKKILNLKFGLLSIALGGGILIARIFEFYGIMKEEGYFAMIFLFGGISLVIYYFLEKRIQQ